MSAPERPRPSTLDWLGVVLVGCCGVLSALVEALLVPLYAGSVVVPVAVVLALVGNAVLPRLSRALVPTTFAALVPLLGWLVVMIGFGLVTRPEGDVILPGAPQGAEWVTYGVLLGGAVVGTVTLVMTSPPPNLKPSPTPNRGSARRPG